MNWNWNQWKAAGKHAASYAAGGVTVAVIFGLINSNQAADANADINFIVEGIKSIAKGIAGLLAIITPIYTAWRAANNASPVNQAIGLQTAVPETKIITSPEIAAATPQNKNIMSNEEVKIITK